MRRTLPNKWLRLKIEGHSKILDLKDCKALPFTKSVFWLIILYSNSRHSSLYLADYKGNLGPHLASFQIDYFKSQSGY